MLKVIRNRHSWTTLLVIVQCDVGYFIADWSASHLPSIDLMLYHTREQAEAALRDAQQAVHS